MKTADELVRFTAFAAKQGMDTTSDEDKFRNLATAVAWTKWLEDARAFADDFAKDDQPAPKITPADINANIAEEYYFNAAHAITYNDGGPSVVPPAQTALLTFCVLVLRNGFVVTGESACASPANFHTETGRRIARENAMRKVWTLMGYELRTKLAWQSGPMTSDQA